MTSVPCMSLLPAGPLAVPPSKCIQSCFQRRIWLTRTHADTSMTALALVPLNFPV